MYWNFYVEIFRMKRLITDWIQSSSPVSVAPSINQHY